MLFDCGDGGGVIFGDAPGLSHIEMQRNREREREIEGGEKEEVEMEKEGGGKGWAGMLDRGEAKYNKIQTLFYPGKSHILMQEPIPRSRLVCFLSFSFFPGRAAAPRSISLFSQRIEAPSPS